MLTAIFTDIHANRQAFTACLDEARRRGVERFVLLGDYVGYGADPEWVVATVEELVSNGAAAIYGNHDAAVCDARLKMGTLAQTAIEWTKGRLGSPEVQFLSSLPPTIRDGPSLFVHSEASEPSRWIYVDGAETAARSMQSTTAEITFCGHIHQPAIYSLSFTAKMTAFTPTANVAIHLLPRRQWLVVVGAVGQPRDGDPAACFVLFDDQRREVTFCRVAYDIDTAAERIRSRGLPSFLADRLYRGK